MNSSRSLRATAVMALLLMIGFYVFSLRNTCNVDRD